YLMGVMLQQGIGVKQDKVAALSYFRRAADLGNRHGQLAAGEALRNAFAQLPKAERQPGYDIAVKMLECALSQDMAEAGHILGRHYLNFMKDTPTALLYFQKAAALGDNDSLWKLYTTFNEGKYGVDKNPELAVCYE
ncbi:SEL1-like repeat protein, partial [Zestomonas carbonaria]